MKRMFALAGALILGLAPIASAHVVFAEPQAVANSYYAGFLRVGHGCNGSPTRSVRVEIPDTVLIARPQPKPGWRLRIERTPLAAPVPSEGGEITERVAAITWQGQLPADEFDQFGIMMRLPDTPGPLYFRVIQTCARGVQSWTDIPAPGAAWTSVAHPAPVLNLTVAPQIEGEHEHHH